MVALNLTGFIQMLAYLMSRNEPKYNNFCKEKYILWVK